VLGVCGWSTPRLSPFTPGKRPSVHFVGCPQGRSGRVQKISTSARLFAIVRTLLRFPITHTSHSTQKTIIQIADPCSVHKPCADIVEISHVPLTLRIFFFFTEHKDPIFFCVFLIYGDPCHRAWPHQVFTFGFDPPTVLPVAIRYTDYAIPAHV
jgi:hypothetical protein